MVEVNSPNLGNDVAAIQVQETHRTLSGTRKETPNTKNVKYIEQRKGLGRCKRGLSHI